MHGTPQDPSLVGLKIRHPAVYCHGIEAIIISEGITQPHVSHPIQDALGIQAISPTPRECQQDAARRFLVSRRLPS